jgi:hypothetical protein
VSARPEIDLTTGDRQALGKARSELIGHLHTHPDHAHRYKAGHDFVLVSTADIQCAHQRQHSGVSHDDDEESSTFGP